MYLQMKTLLICCQEVLSQMCLKKVTKTLVTLVDLHSLQTKFKCQNKWKNQKLSCLNVKLHVSDNNREIRFMDKIPNVQITTSDYSLLSI